VTGPVKIDLCESCDAEIFWARTQSGKAMPVDVDPRPDGNVVVVDQDPLTVLVLKGGEPAGGLRYVSHFATCSHANQHRRRGKRKTTTTVEPGPTLL